jgi:hypothetical protein
MVMRTLLALVFVLLPATTSAQWAFSTYTGTSHTRPSTITVDRPDVGQTLEFIDTQYDARPFKAAPYYGLRVTRFFSEARKLGLEVELLHNKVYARTGEVVRVRGTSAGTTIDSPLLMNTLVQRYNQSHGLSFVLANLVWRQSLGEPGSRFSVLARAGTGPVISGRDIVMNGLNVQGYELSGIGAHASAGLTTRIAGRVSAMVEYKFTYARPEINLTGGGHGRMAAASHHITAGLTIGK